MYQLDNMKIHEIAGGDDWGLSQIGYAIGQLLGSAMRASACAQNPGPVLSGAALEAAIAEAQANDSSGLI